MTSLSNATLADIRALYDQVLTRIVALQDEHLVFAQFGDFSASKVDQIIRLVESALLENGLKRPLVKRFCNMLIECLQNVANHGTRDQEGRMNAFAIVSTNSGHSQLVCGNLILRLDANSLTERLDRINRMESHELRKYFIDTLCNDPIDTQGGAGLGLLTIAKKATGGIGYQIVPLDNHFAYLILTLRVS